MWYMWDTWRLELSLTSNTMCNSACSQHPFHFIHMRMTVHIFFLLSQYQCPKVIKNLSVTVSGVSVLTICHWRSDSVFTICHWHSVRGQCVLTRLKFGYSSRHLKVVLALCKGLSQSAQRPCRTGHVYFGDSFLKALFIQLQDVCNHSVCSSTFFSYS